MSAGRNRAVTFVTLPECYPHTYHHDGRGVFWRSPGGLSLRAKSEENGE
jgi:hypothetical protein